VIAWISSTSLIQASEPPDSQEILDTISGFGKQKQFDEIDAYMANLMQNNGNYLPARIVDAIHALKRGAQAEEHVEKMTALLKTVQKFPADIPPFCKDEIERIISLYSEAVKRYAKLGWSKKWRLQRFNPRNPNLTLTSWGFNHIFLFLSCPPVVFPQNPAQPVKIHHRVKVDSKMLSLNVQELHLKIQDKKSDIVERAAAIKAFNQKANEDEIAYLTECLSLDDFRLATVCAAALSENDYDKRLAPILLKMVADKKTSTSVAELAIWALIRMGNRIPSTLPTLKKLAHKNLFWTSDIEEAIDYLQQKK
jgi:hypothetical protein